MIFKVIFVHSSKSAASVSSDGEEDSNSESLCLVLLRDNVPDQELPCKDATEKGERFAMARI